MNAFLQKLEFNFYSELQTILQTGTPNNVHLAFELSQKYLADLKNEIMNRGFKNTEDEITCFKLVKPKLESETIYFRAMLIGQEDLPFGSDERKKAYLDDYLMRFYIFFEENKEFIRYYRSGATDLDHQFYIRENARLNKDYLVDFAGIDFRCNTGYDMILARYLAFEKLENRVRYELFRMNNINEVWMNPGDSPSYYKKVLKWTGSKAALVELIYALHAVGVVNDSQIELRVITQIMEDIFQIELGDHYRIYHDLRSRKIQRTKFLNQLVETLVRRMEADDG